MAYVNPSEILDMLPSPTAVTEDETTGFIEGIKARLDEAYGSTVEDPLTAPETEVTREIVLEGTYAKALKRHYLKGEGSLETPAADTELARLEDRLKAYDARHTSPAERNLEAPVAYIQKVSW